VIRGQKWSVILEMLWLACYNSEIDWRIREVKITRCLEECKKQWRPKQGKLGWEKQKKKEKKKKEGKKQEQKEQKRKEKEKPRKRIIEVQKIAEE